MKVRHDMVTVFVVRPREPAATHELLQLRRAAADYMGGTWQMVRGVAEGPESAPQAAVRELREETGLTPLELYGLSSLDCFYTAKFDTIWHCAVFAALVDRGTEVRLNDEHDAYRWVPMRDVPPLLMWQRERELVAEIEREILAPRHPLLRKERGSRKWLSTYRAASSLNSSAAFANLHADRDTPRPSPTCLPFLRCHPAARSRTRAGAVSSPASRCAWPPSTSAQTPST